MRKRDLLEKIKEFIKGFFGDSIDDIKENKAMCEKLQQQISSLENDIIATIDNQSSITNLEINKILNYLKDEVKIADEKVNSIEKDKAQIESQLQLKESEIANQNNEIQKIKAKLTELETTIQNKENEINSLKQEKENMQQEISSIQNDNNKLTKELDQFKKTFKEEKIIKLLRTIINNPTLETYREKENIKDETPASILNLLLKLSDYKTFIESYYNYLLEYKKEHQEEMKDEEIEFYEAINNYFNDEIIKNPTAKKVDEVFDKSKHRGVNNERDGKIDDEIVLIPADIGNNDKIRVKLK